MDVSALAREIINNTQRVIIGKEKEIELIISALFSGGNVLIEDVPGTGKTMLSRAIAASIEGEYKRIQFTPDLLPGDLTGITYFNPKEGEFIFRRGAIFTNVLLADEINRATPRTQSALLEAMEEKQITVDGTTYTLNPPFFVIATQNPVETQGTYPLPEAQLDRFTIKLSLGYPEREQYLDLINTHTKENPLDTLEPVCKGEDIVNACLACKDIYTHPDLVNYIVDLGEATRCFEGIALGLSTRGILWAVNMSKAYCAVKGRKYVTPEDIKLIFPYVACHRLILKGGYKHRENYALDAVNEILAKVQVPTEDWSGS